MTHWLVCPAAEAPPIWLVGFGDPVSVGRGRRVMGAVVDDATRSGAGAVVLVDLSGLRRVTEAWIEMLAGVRRAAIANGIVVRARRHRVSSIRHDHVPTPADTHRREPTS